MLGGTYNAYDTDGYCGNALSAGDAGDVYATVRGGYGAHCRRGDVENIYVMTSGT